MLRVALPLENVHTLSSSAARLAKEQAIAYSILPKIRGIQGLNCSES